MSELFILRHGNTFDPGDVVTRVGARTDLALSASGRAQAEAVAAHFAGRGLRFQRIFAAPLKRTAMTAGIVRAAIDGPVAEALDFLTEIDYGPDENQPEEIVVARIGEAALAAWEKDAVPPPGWRVDPAALIRFALDAADSLAGAFPRKLKTCAWGTVVARNGDAVVTGWNIRP